MKRFVLWGIVGAIFYTASCYHGHGLSPLPSGVQGHIVFQGVWPDSTSAVRVVALKSFPWGVTNRDSLLAFFQQAFLTGNLGYSDPLPLFSEECDYVLELNPGLWERISVVWFPDNLMGLKEIGTYYENPANPGTPFSVVITSGRMQKGINIAADFIHVDSESPFLESGEKP